MMIQKYLSKKKIFTGFVSLLLVFSFLSGCVQNSATSNTAPITVTIHSAYKTTEFNGVTAKEGTFFVITNMTIENHGRNAYTFNEKAVTITHGTPVEEKLYTRLTDHRYWGEIPSHEKRTGDVIFGVKNSTQDFAITFFYNKGQDSFTQELGTIPIGAGSAPSATQPNTGDNTPATLNAKPITATIHSAFTTSVINGSIPMAGRIFVVVNMTVENDGDSDYALNENTVDITGGGPLTQKLYTQLRNPLYWGSIPAHERRTGEVVFAVINNTQQYTVTFLNSNKQVILSQELGTIPGMKY